jgi:hypothetical protein
MMEQLRFQALIDLWLFEQFGWQRDPEDLLF